MPIFSSLLWICLPHLVPHSTKSIVGQVYLIATAFGCKVGTNNLGWHRTFAPRPPSNIKFSLIPSPPPGLISLIIPTSPYGRYCCVIVCHGIRLVWKKVSILLGRVTSWSGIVLGGATFLKTFSIHYPHSPHTPWYNTRIIIPQTKCIFSFRNGFKSITLKGNGERVMGWEGILAHFIAPTSSTWHNSSLPFSIIYVRGGWG